MKLTRRAWLGAVGALPLATRGGAGSLRQDLHPAMLPDRSSFEPMRLTYLDSGSVHPVSRGAKAAVIDYFQARSAPGTGSTSVPDKRVLASFARLINADPADVAFVKSTTTAEHLIVDGLGLFDGKAHVVTDTLHFFGSFPLYAGLERQGTGVTWVRPRDGRIHIDDIARAITPRTKLVALSLVSTYNGFEHDLAAVCELAHARGALVYADIVHAAGCVPIDVQASGVDFAACSSYKWLMADFGLGFVYARPEARDRLQRKRYGYYGVAAFQSHTYPFDPPGENVVDFTMQENATGYFATGTYSHATAIHLDHSLTYILDLGVERINAHAQALVGRLKADLPRFGYKVATPAESRAPIVTCVLEDARSLAPRLEAAKVKITVGRNRFRVTPSVFNTMDDIDRLLDVLGPAGGGRKS